MDHSLDLLSVLRHSNCPDLDSFFRILDVFPTTPDSKPYQQYTVVESEEELVLKEWIRKEGGKDFYQPGSFISSTCDYLEDVKSGLK